MRLAFMSNVKQIEMCFDFSGTYVGRQASGKMWV